MAKPDGVDHYIAQLPESAQGRAREIRAIIAKAAPLAEEKLSYGMPYYHYHGRLIYWAAHQSYLGLYVMAGSRAALSEEMQPYRTAKATLHFPLDQPLPKSLITRIVKAQVVFNDKKS